MSYRRNYATVAEEDESKRTDAEGAMSEVGMHIGNTTLRQMRKAGDTMLGRFNYILETIESIESKPVKAELMIKLSRLYLIDLPSRLPSMSIRLPEKSDDKAIDAIYNEIK